MSDSAGRRAARRSCRPGKGNDKGKVEGLVKHARMKFMTPIPHAASYDAFNAELAERCRARQGERAGRALSADPPGSTLPPIHTCRRWT